jgi:hypothetical protein
MKKEHIIAVAGEKVIVTSDSVTFHKKLDAKTQVKIIQYCSKEGFFGDTRRIKVNVPKNN